MKSLTFTPIVAFLILGGATVHAHESLVHVALLVPDRDDRVCYDETIQVTDPSTAPFRLKLCSPITGSLLRLTKVAVSVNGLPIAGGEEWNEATTIDVPDLLLVQGANEIKITVDRARAAALLKIFGTVPHPVPPAPPLFMDLHAVEQPGFVAVSWMASPSEDVVKYQVFRGHVAQLQDQLVTEVPVSDAVEGACEVNDRHAAVGEIYYYSVIAISDAGLPSDPVVSDPVVNPGSDSSFLPRFGSSLVLFKRRLDAGLSAEEANKGGLVVLEEDGSVAVEIMSEDDVDPHGFVESLRALGVHLGGLGAYLGIPNYFDASVKPDQFHALSRLNGLQEVRAWHSRGSGAFLEEAIPSTPCTFSEPSVRQGAPQPESANNGMNPTR